jgi:hypothetical protein
VAAKAAEALLARKTASGFVAYRDENLIAYLIGDQLPGAERTFMSSKKDLRAFDNDSGMTMLRIGSMNLMLHGIESPQFFYMDTLSKSFNDEREYDVILMNPPFKGAVDKGDVHPSLPRRRRWNSSGSIHCLALFAGLITENLAGSNPFLLIPS